MKLKNSLYTIARRAYDGGVWRYDVRLDAKHVIYQAHFPERPVTPGVCIIQMAKELIEEATGKRLDVWRLKNVKFLGVMSPVETPVVSWLVSRLTLDDEGYKAQVEARVDDTVLAKISVALR